MGDGPYLILPFLGPSNLRDTVGRFVDTKLDPVGYVRSMRLRNSLWGLRTLSHRADLLDTSRILETAALDPYEFLRDAYLQRRRNLVHDGAPPREKDDDAELNFKPGAKPAAGAANTVAPAIQPTNFTTLATEDQTPARTAAQEPIAAPVVELQLLAAQWSEPVAAPVELAIKPKTEVIAPVAPTPASPAAELQTPASRVIRVWASAAQ